MRLSFYALEYIALIAACLQLKCPALEQRDRFSGLNRVEASSTMGKGNAFLSLYGRGFLWDNGAASKVPTMIPNAEFSYGLLEFLQIGGGIQIMKTKPGLAFLKLKVTTPNNKNVRLIGVGQTVALYRNLVSEFMSNGFRYRNEGFSPDTFIMGNPKTITFFRMMTLLDFEMIKLVSFLPFKFYLNAGYEGQWDSWMGRNLKEARESYDRTLASLSSGRAGNEKGHYGTTNFTKIPLLLGVELKTLSTDFFVELETEPFQEHLKAFFSRRGKDRYWVRYNLILEQSPPMLKVVDIHLYESPFFMNVGARLKYPGGMSIQGGFSWLLSKDKGPLIGPCEKQEACREMATDGFSPFFPQWRLFGMLRYPIKFKQTSAELYRIYLLRKNSKDRKVIDIDRILLEERQDKRSEESSGKVQVRKKKDEILKHREEAKREKID